MTIFGRAGRKVPDPLRMDADVSSTPPSQAHPTATAVLADDRSRDDDVSPQRRYDYRLRALVQRTGDLTSVTDPGVPALDGA